MKHEMIKPGDAVQIVDQNHHWFPCIIIVEKIKSWGCQGYITIPNNDRDETNGSAYIRLNRDQYVFIGQAPILNFDLDDE